MRGLRQTDRRALFSRVVFLAGLAELFLTAVTKGEDLEGKCGEINRATFVEHTFKRYWYLLTNLCDNGEPSLIHRLKQWFLVLNCVMIEIKN